MSGAVTIENGFAVIDAGTWLASRGQPAAFFGEVVRRRRKGWLLRDRAALELIELKVERSKVEGREVENLGACARFADAARPFLTHIPCAVPINAVSSKVLVAPAGAWAGAELVRVVPMSVKGSLVVSRFGSLESTPIQASNDPNLQTSNKPNLQTSNFVVMATASRTARIAVEDGDTLSVRPEAVVAWTGNRPTGFVRKLGIWDVILPRTPRDLMLHFHGPCIVWIEGSTDLRPSTFGLRPSTYDHANRRCVYGI